jgi:hypothetical protein
MKTLDLNIRLTFDDHLTNTSSVVEAVLKALNNWREASDEGLAGKNETYTTKIRVQSGHQIKTWNLPKFLGKTK